MEQTGGPTSGGDAATGKEPKRKLTGASKDAARVLFNLAKTSRSFGFYDRHNKAIQVFLDELFFGFTDFLTEHGALLLGVMADRFLHDGDVVYIDPDREDGLPFKLFRDGIRAVGFQPGLKQDELEKFLNLLARRTKTGKDAEETDLVTLIWELSFEHIV